MRPPSRCRCRSPVADGSRAVFGGFRAGAAGRECGQAGAEPRNAARNAAAAGGGTLFPRLGPVVLQHAFIATARSARRQFAVDAGSDGQCRHRRYADSRNGRSGRNALGIGLHRPVPASQTVTDHRHGLAKDQPAGTTAHANFGSNPTVGRSAAGAAGFSVPGSLTGRRFIRSGALRVANSSTSPQTAHRHRRQSTDGRHGIQSVVKTYHSVSRQDI